MCNRHAHVAQVWGDPHEREGEEAEDRYSGPLR